MSYAQSLWQEIAKDGTDLSVTNNGIVEALYTVISAYLIESLVPMYYILYPNRYFRILVF